MEGLALALNLAFHHLPADNLLGAQRLDARKNIRPMHVAHFQLVNSVLAEECGLRARILADVQRRRDELVIKVEQSKGELLFVSEDLLNVHALRHCVKVVLLVNRRRRPTRGHLSAACQ